MSTAVPQTFPSLDAWEDDRSWQEKLNADATALRTILPARLRPLHQAVAARARQEGARALILSGSTARRRRTEISDLDYHLIGPTFNVKELSRELDVHFLTPEELLRQIRDGDDFVQWSLRFGLVVFDHDALRRASELIATEHPWPDVSRKRVHAERSLGLAHRFIETGDQDGAVEQVRTALSISARAYLLSVGVFPLSRAELPSQLRASGHAAAAAGLEATIFDWPELSDLELACAQGDVLLRDSVAVIELSSRRQSKDGPQAALPTLRRGMT